MTEPKLFERGRLTDWIMATLLSPPLAALDTPILVGDGVAPPDGGWAGGQPGQGAFKPYTVLTTGPATKLEKQPLGPSEAVDWVLRYQLRHAGGQRNMVDWVADQVRLVWDSQAEIRLLLNEDPPHWKASGFMVVTMGAVNRNDTVEPPFWTLVDDVQLSLSRCRT